MAKIIPKMVKMVVFLKTLRPKIYVLAMVIYIITEESKCLEGSMYLFKKI